MSVIATIALVVAGLAALLHGYIFWLEAFAWTTPRGTRTFGTTVEQAEQSKDLAYNQGFYNLFLGIVTIIGIILAFAGEHAVGIALVFAGVGSMALAALVLVTRAPSLARSAAVQGTLPALAVVLLVIGVLV